MAQARKKTDTTFSFNIVRHIRYGLQESGFLLFVGLALYLIMALLSYTPGDPAWRHNDGSTEIRNLAGVTGAWFSDIALYFFGYFAYLLPLGIVFGGWRIFKRDALLEIDAEIVIFRCLGFIVTLGAGCGLAYFYVDNGQITAIGGGVLGQFIGDHLITAFGRFGAGLFLIALFMAGINLTTGVPWLTIIDTVGKITLEALNGLVRGLVLLRSCLRFIPRPAAKTDRRLLPKVGRRQSPLNDRAALPAIDAVEVEPQKGRAARTEPLLRLPDTDPGPRLIATSAAEVGGSDESDDVDELYEPAASAVRAKVRQTPGVHALSPLPPLDLLDMAPSEQTGYSSEILDEMSRQVETLLRHFGIEVQVVAVEPGPVITRFELDPAPGVKVSQITNLAKDLARGLSVISVRVVEVIPGKSVIGLEIPNQHRDVVYLSEILDSPTYAKTLSPLTLGLGKDIGGRPVVANIAKMPHLLVAGTTGSGKSVAVNAMLLSILYKARPDEVRLIMVDPKMLELSIYEGIPHLLAPVVTDMKEAANALRWCVAEMERRYRLMAALKVRNIAGFNRKVLDAIDAGEAIIDPLYKPEDQLDDQLAAPTLEPLPFIVVVIDELADMMMIVGKKVEELIARLAQKARASGIHLILATQRPSVDVITGLIKANIPTRIAFQVSSKIDSRTILDQMGAEQLLGHGDMLYLPPGTGFPQRVHGAFVDDHEVHRVVEFLKSTGTPDYCDDVLRESLESGDGSAADIGLPTGDGGGDPLYDQAVRIVTETRRASISGVQRRLKIGYNRAARLIEEMETAGIVGSLESNGSREVLAPPPPAD